MAAGFGRNLGGILAGAFSFNAIAQQFSAALSQAGQLQDLSDAFGVSAEAIQRIGNAAAESGGSLQDVGRALAKIGLGAQQAFNGNEQLASSFAAIGVSGQDLINLSPEQLFYRLAAAMNDGSLAGKDLAVAKDLLGRGFATLMPVLKMTEDQIRAVGAAAGVMSDDAVAKLDSFGDSWGRLSNIVKVRAAEIIDASIRLGEEVMANPMSLFGDWQQIEKRIEERQRKDKEARDALRALRPEDDAESAQNAKALQELKLGFEQTAREKRRRMDDEEHAEAMKRAKEIIEKIDEQNKAREAGQRAISQIEDIRAERAGPQAEFDLLKRRAQESADLARQTGSVQDTLVAEKAAQTLQNALQRSFEQGGFGDAAAARARDVTQGLVGSLPNQALRDIAMQNVNQDPPRNATVAAILQTLPQVVNRLDLLIRQAGTFVP